MTTQGSRTQEIEPPKPLHPTDSCNPHCIALLAAALSKVNTDVKISEQQLNEIKAQIEGKSKEEIVLNENPTTNETIHSGKASHAAIEDVASHATPKQCPCPPVSNSHVTETPERVDLSLAFSTLGIQTHVNFTNFGDRVNALQNGFGWVFHNVRLFIEDPNLRNTLATTVDLLLILYALSYLCIYICNCYMIDNEED